MAKPNLKDLTSLNERRACIQGTLRGKAEPRVWVELGQEKPKTLAHPRVTFAEGRHGTRQATQFDDPGVTQFVDRPVVQESSIIIFQGRKDRIQPRRQEAALFLLKKFLKWASRFWVREAVLLRKLPPIDGVAHVSGFVPAEVPSGHVDAGLWIVRDLAFPFPGL